MKSTRTIFLTFLPLLILMDGAQSQDLKTTASNTLQSVVLIISEDRNGNVLGYGSGFYISEDLVTTNFHVIESANKVFVKFINNELRYPVAGIFGEDQENDIVILQILRVPAPFLNLLGDRNFEIGEEIYVAGNPYGFEGTFSNGIISGVRKLDDNIKLIQITAPISPGSNGGPVINSSGDVLGMVVSYVEGGQNLNFVVPSFYVQSLLYKSRLQRPKPFLGRREVSSLENDKESRFEQFTFETWSKIKVGGGFNLFAYALKGYGFSGWMGKNKLRLVIDYYVVDIPDAMVRDGFTEGKVDNAFRLSIDYFFNGNFLGPYLGVGFQQATYSSGHVNTLERGSWKTIDLIASIGYKLDLVPHVHFDSRIALDAILYGETRVKVGGYELTPDNEKLYAFIGFGIHF